MTEQPTDYYARRADEERLAAEIASDERAAQSHRELAAHYARVASGEEKPPSDELVAGKRPGAANHLRIVP